jgi:hypothetical protein
MDPRGLVVFDSPIGPDPPPPISIDQAILSRRHDALRTLADATDGLAMLNSNNLDAGLKRMSDDLSSYYLLGYYTTTPLDGKFHKITVRVKRPGVQVRARRGYLAPKRGELTGTALPPPASPVEAKAAAEARAIESLVSPLNQYTRELPLRLHSCSTSSEIWIAGELGTSEARNWPSGGMVDLLLVSETGQTVGTQHVTLAAGARTFEAAIPVPAAGDYDVKVRARSATESAAPIDEDLKVSTTESLSGARFMRRGPSTANHDVPAADLRFRRSETIRVEWPGRGVGASEAHLLDRTGKALAVPVSTALREADGITWQTAQLALAPLAAGDYVIELDTGSERRLAAFRVVQ